MTEDAAGPVVLVPDRVQAWLWTVIGAIAVLLAGTATDGSSLGALAVIMVLLGAVPTAVFAVQALAPASWTLTVDTVGLHGVVAGVHVDVPFDGVRAVERGGLFGDHTLVVLTQHRRRVFLLPVGCDLDALDEVLAAFARRAARTSAVRPWPSGVPSAPSTDGDQTPQE